VNKQKLVNLFKNPSSIDERQLAELEAIIKENPYFQSAYALLAAGRKKIEPGKASKDLTKAAIYATNRIFLKKYIESGSGGMQATKVERVDLSPPAIKTPVKPTDAKVKKGADDSPPAKEAATGKPQFKERFHDQSEKPRIKIRRREDAEREAAAKKEEPKSIQKEKPSAEPTDAIPEIKRDTDIDLGKLLNHLKSEYQQLQVNMDSFHKAEKNLSAAEKEEEKKSEGAEASEEPKSVESKAKPAKKTTPKKNTVKSSASKAKTISKTTKAKTKTSAKAKTSTAKAKPKPLTTKKSTAPKSAKLDSGSEDDDDLLAGDDANSKKKEQSKIIDKFIETAPRIKPKKSKEKETTKQLIDLSSKNQVLTDDMVTENLANIMIKQGRIEKAIEIYHKLIWKFPHKKAYFAGRIKELKEQ